MTNSARAGAIVMLLAAVAACRDGSTGPTPGDTVAIEMRKGSVPFEEETITPGGTLQLSAVLLDAAGSTQNAGGADWSSTNTSVASVDASGKVTAEQVGSTRIVVRAGERADTGVVNVANPVSGELVCAPGNPDLALATGDVRVLVGEETVDLCLPGGALGASYLLVPFNASSAAGARLDTRIVASAPTLSTSIAPASPSTDRITAWGLPVREGPARDERFHQLHLERSRAEFEPALRMSISAPTGAARALPSIGQHMRLNAATLSGSGCANPDYRTGRVVAISDRAVIVADTMNPANGFTASDYAAIGDTFDDLIWSVNTATFGNPTDIDDNGRVIIFYTRAVNELTPAGSDSYVGGFFYNRDLFPKSGSSACAASNEAEMFYMLVPDPTGEINGNQRSKSFVLERTYSVLAHEFQHLINDSRRLYVNDALVWEEAWLNEGLSHIAEELAFYAASGHRPGQNLGSGPFSSETSLAFDRYNLDNVERYIRYLQEPEAHSLMGNVDELATRGASWVFLRYAADRIPGDDATIWSNLVNSKTRGLANLQEVLGVNPRSWMLDWEVSVFTDDAGLQVNDEYTQPSWHFRALTASMHRSGQFPLRTRSAGPTSPTMSLPGGAAAFIRLSVDPGDRRAVRTTVAGLPPPSRLNLAVVRTR